MIKYYTSLVKKYAHPIDITFEYGHSLGSIDLTSEGRRMLSLYSSQSKLKARMVDTVKHLDLVPGCFLSAMMEVNINGEWVHFMDLSDEQKVLADADIKKSIIGLIDRLEIGR